jgi:hypothetical protein
MKKYFFPCLVMAMCLISQPVFSQADDDTALLGLPGDNLDLYAVLDLFKKSKTIEGFEKALNEQKSGINNLDLDMDKKVDFIKVITKQKDSSFTFILQVDVSKEEKQDVAVILVDKKKGGEITMQIVGDKALYGKNYIVEPKATPSVTANPAYKGPDPVIVNVPATTTVVVQSAPIVQYVYSPAYVPYVPPYYYGYHPPYFAAFTILAVGIYRSNNYYHHGHGGYGNTTIIHNENNFNNYNGGDRNTSNRVEQHNRNGDYGNRDRANNRDANRGSGDRGSGGRGNSGPSASTRPSTGAGNRPSTRPSTSQSRPQSRPSSSDFSSGRSRGSSGGGMRGGGGGRRRG